MGRIEELTLLPDKFSSPLDEDLQEKVNKKKVKALNIANRSCPHCYGRGYLKRNYGGPFNIFEYCGKCLRKYRRKNQRKKER